jgi:hypothetical protein
LNAADKKAGTGLGVFPNKKAKRLKSEKLPILEQEWFWGSIHLL